MNWGDWLSFERNRPAILVIHGGLFLMVFLFGAEVFLTGGSPMTPEIYGEFVYTIPAWTWIVAQMFSGGLCAISAVRLWRWGLIVGASVGCILYSMFSVLASWADQGSLMRSGAFAIALMPTVTTLLIGARNER